MILGDHTNGTECLLETRYTSAMRESKALKKRVNIMTQSIWGGEEKESAGGDGKKDMRQWDIRLGGRLGRPVGIVY